MTTKMYQTLFHHLYTLFIVVMHYMAKHFNINLNSVPGRITTFYENKEKLHEKTKQFVYAYVWRENQQTAICSSINGTIQQELQYSKEAPLTSLSLIIRLLRQWIPRNWNLLMNLMLGKEKAGILMPAKEEICFLERGFTQCC